MGLHFTDLFKRPSFFAFGGLALFLLIWFTFFFQKPHLDYSDKTQILTIEVLERPHTDFERNRFRARVLNFNPSIDIQVTLNDARITLIPGDVYIVRGKLKEPRTLSNPGGFDYENYLFRKNIAATVFINDAADMTLQKKADGWISAFYLSLDDIKKQIKQTSTQIAPDVAGLFVSLLWGDSTQLSPEHKDLFRRQGLSHLLVVSGLHFVSLGSFFFFIFEFLFAFVLRWNPSFPVKKGAMSASWFFLTLFYLFCEPGASVDRAYFGYSLFCLAYLFNRTSDSLNLLFWAGFLILLLSPSALFDVSFQLSFVACAGLMIVYPVLKERLKIKNGFIKTIADLFLIQLVMTFCVTPLVLYYFYEWAPSGLISNIIFVPLIEVVLAPVSFFSSLVCLLHIGAGYWAMTFSLKLVSWCVICLQWFDRLSPSPRLVFPPRLGELVLLYVILILLCFRFEKLRFKKTVCLLLTIIFFISYFDVGLALFPPKNKMVIRQLDVGQGDSTLISVFNESGKLKNILIDGGGSAYVDIGQRVLVPLLLTSHLNKLDVVVMTHADMDHYGGLLNVAKNFEVGELWWNGIKKDDAPVMNEILDVAASKKIPAKILQVDEQILLTSKSIFKVLNSGQTDATDNNSSLVLKLVTSHFKALFTGDIESIKEDQLVLKYGPELHSDYLKVAHHGSRTSSSQNFIEQVSPQMAVAGMGYKSHFHHPHAEVVERFNDLHIPFLRTDYSGMIETDVDLDSGKYCVKTYREQVLVPILTKGCE